MAGLARDFYVIHELSFIVDFAFAPPKTALEIAQRHGAYFSMYWLPTYPPSS